MAIRTKCKHCGAKYNVRADLVGKKLRCKECDDSFVVSDLDAISNERVHLAKARPSAVRPDDSGERTPRRKRQAADDDRTRQKRQINDDDELPRERRRSQQPKQKSTLPWIIGGSAAAAVLLGTLIVVIIVANSGTPATNLQPAEQLAIGPDAKPISNPPQVDSKQQSGPADTVVKVSDPVVAEIPTKTNQPPIKPIPAGARALIPASKHVSMPNSLSHRELKVTAGSKFAAIDYLDNGQTPTKNYIGIYDLQKGIEVRRIEVPKGAPLKTIDLSADGEYVAALRNESLESQVLVWSVQDGTLLPGPLVPFPRSAGSTAQGATVFVLPNKRLAVVSKAGQAGFWHLESKQLLGATPPLPGLIPRTDADECALSPSQRLLAIIDGQEKRIICIDVEKGAMVGATTPFHETTESIQGLGLAFSPDEKLVAVCWQYSTQSRASHMGVGIFQVSNGERVFTDTRYHHVVFGGLSWHSDRYLCLYAKSNRSDILLFDTQRKHIVQLIRGAESSGRCATSPEGELWYLAKTENPSAWSLQATALPETIIADRSIGEVKTLGELPKLFLFPEGVKLHHPLAWSLGGPLLWQ